MKKYLLFLLVNTLKKYSTTLILILFGISFGTLLNLQITSNKKPNAAIYGLYDYFYYIPFVFGSIYVGIKAINIFKEGENNGRELLIISRPLSRKTILISKFLIMFFHIILFSIVVFFTCFIFAQPEAKKAAQLGVFKFSLSLTIGSFIICLLMSGVIILTSFTLSKVGTVIATTVIPALLVIFSGIIIVLSKGQIKTTGSARFAYNQKMIQEGSKGFVTPTGYYSTSTGYRKIQESGWYDKVKYLDVFTQFKQFYNFLLPKTIISSTAQKLTVQKHTFQSDIFLRGLIFDSNNPNSTQTKNFIFLPALKDNYLWQKEVFVTIMKNKQFLSNEIMEYMSNIYSSPTKTLTSSQKNIKPYIEKFVKPDAINEYKMDTITNNYASQRFGMTMHRIMMGYFNELNLKPKKTLKEQQFIKEFINSFAHWWSVNKTPVTFLESINLFNSNYFTITKSTKAEIPLIMSLFIYEKIFPQKLNENQTKNKIIKQTYTNPNVQKLAKDFKPLYISGKYHNKNIIGSQEQDFLKNSWSVNLFLNNTSLTEDKVVSWVPAGIVYAIWVPITLIVTVLVIVKFFRTDFK